MKRSRASPQPDARACLSLTHLRAFGRPAAEDLEEAVNLVGVAAETGEQEVEVDQTCVLVAAQLAVEGKGDDVLRLGNLHMQNTKN